MTAWGHEILFDFCVHDFFEAERCEGMLLIIFRLHSFFRVVTVWKDDCHSEYGIILLASLNWLMKAAYHLHESFGQLQPHAFPFPLLYVYLCAFKAVCMSVSRCRAAIPLSSSRALVSLQSGKLDSQDTSLPSSHAPFCIKQPLQLHWSCSFLKVVSRILFEGFCSQLLRLFLQLLTRFPIPLPSLTDPGHLQSGKQDQSDALHQSQVIV